MYLLTHRERVVAKQELAEQVWAAQVTSDAALETGIRAVRQAVGDSGRAQQIIRTHYGHGYQFVAAVTVLPSASVAAASSHVETMRPRRDHAAAPTRRCFACGYVPRVAAAFCIACGARLCQYCARCGHAVWLPASQCAACAWPVTDIAPGGRVMALSTSSSSLEPEGPSIEVWANDEESDVFAWRQAGRQALKRAAYSEAAHCFQAALGRLASLPATADRKRRDLQLYLVYLALGGALMASQGYTASEVGATYRRAHALGEEIGDLQLLFAALRGLRRFYGNRGDLWQARSCGERLLNLAQRSRNPVDLQEAHYSLGYTLYSLGEFHLATTHLSQGIALLDPKQLNSMSFYLICHDLMASCLWLMGYPDQAVAQIRQVLPLAQACANPLTMAHVFFHTAQLHQWRQETQVAQKWTEDMIALATQCALPHWLAAGMHLQGWVLTQQGRFAEGIQHLQEGVKASRKRHAYISCQQPLALLADAYGKTGDIQQGLNVLDEGFELVAQTSGHWREAEFHRLKGELFAAQARTRVDAEACFQQALDITRSQGAKSLELRAATSLSRLWRRQGKREAARKLLTDSYAWFTEGFESRDLRAAQALLTTLV